MHSNNHNLMKPWLSSYTLKYTKFDSTDWPNSRNKINNMQTMHDYKLAA